MKVVNINQNDSALEMRWDKFVDSHPEGQIYFTNDWLKIIQKESNAKMFRLMCLNESDEIVGILPLLTTKGFPFGLGGIPGSKRLSSLPRTPIGGPLVSDESAIKLLIDKAIDMNTNYPERLLQIKSMNANFSESITQLKKYLWREIYLTDIPPYPSEIRFGNSSNHSKIKAAVNKAINNNVTVKYTDSMEDLKEWYKLYAGTMRTNTVPVRSFEFVKNLWNSFSPRGIMKLAIAELIIGGKKKIISGHLFFFYNKTITYSFSGRSHKYGLNIRRNDLIHWKVIHDAQKEGFEIYDWGEASKNDKGLIQYKKKWASRKVELFHYYFPDPNILDTNVLDESALSKFKQHLWNMVPLNLTCFIGKSFYKRL